MALDAKGTVRDARGFASRTTDAATHERELDVHEADDAEGRGEPPDDGPNLVERRRLERRRRQDARGVAGVHARFLDVLHDGRDVRRPRRRRARRRRSRPRPRGSGRRAPARRRTLPHAGRPARSRRASWRRRARTTDARAPGSRPARRPRRPRPPRRPCPRRDGDPELVAERREPLAVLGEVDGVLRRPEDPEAGGLDRAGELERRLAAELDDDARPVVRGDRPRAPPRRRAARSRGGRRSRSRSRRSPGCSSPSRCRSRARGRPSTRGRSSSRTRSPGRSGSARRRESRPKAAAVRAAGRPPRPTWSRGSSSAPRPPRRRSRRSGRRAGRQHSTGQLARPPLPRRRPRLCPHRRARAA